MSALSNAEHGGAPTPEHCAGAPPAPCPVVYLDVRRCPTTQLVDRGRSTLPAGARSLLCSRVQVRTRRARSDRAVCYLFHDPLDGVGAPAALHAAAEAVIDLARPQPLNLRKYGTKLLVAEHVARTDDHHLLLTHISGQSANEEKQDEATDPSRHQPCKLRRGHESAPCSPCLGGCDIPHVPLLRI